MAFTSFDYLIDFADLDPFNAELAESSSPPLLHNVVVAKPLCGAELADGCPADCAAAAVSGPRAKRERG